MLFQRAGGWSEAAVSEAKNEGGPFVQHRCSQKVLQPLELLWAWGWAMRLRWKNGGSGLTLRLVFAGQGEDKWMFYLKCCGNRWEIMPLEGSSWSLFLFTRDKKAHNITKISASPFPFILSLKGSRTAREVWAIWLGFQVELLGLTFLTLKLTILFKISWDFFLLYNHS